MVFLDLNNNILPTQSIKECYLYGYSFSITYNNTLVDCTTVS